MDEAVDTGEAGDGVDSAAEADNDDAEPATSESEPVDQ